MEKEIEEAKQIILAFIEAIEPEHEFYISKEMWERACKFVEKEKK